MNLSEIAIGDQCVHGLSGHDEEIKIDLAAYERMLGIVLFNDINICY